MPIAREGIARKANYIAFTIRKNQRAFMNWKDGRMDGRTRAAANAIPEEAACSFPLEDQMPSEEDSMINQMRGVLGAEIHRRIGAADLSQARG